MPLIPNCHIREISREFIFGGTTKKIDCKKYWACSDDHLSDWGFTQYKFDSEKPFELWRITRELVYPECTYTLKPTCELYVEGKRFSLDDLNIISCHHLKTKLKVKVISGEG